MLILIELQMLTELIHKPEHLQHEILADEIL